MVSDGDASVRIAGRDQVHRRAADEGGDIDGVRPGENVRRTSDLLDLALHEDRHPVGQRHGLLLVVRDVDCRHAEGALQLLELDPRLEPELGVEIGERLVEEEQPRLAHDGAREGAALLLAAGQLAGLAVEQMLDLDLARRPPGPRGAISARLSLRHLERKGDVLEHRHVRVERVALEHHGDVAIARVEAR